MNLYRSGRSVAAALEKALAASALFAGGVVWAADSAPPGLKESLRPMDPGLIPGVGKLVFAFAVTCALAIAGVLLIKRLMPRIANPMDAGAGIRMHGTRQLSRDVRIHIVQIDDTKVLIAESKLSLSVLALLGANAKAADKTP